jgi:hypothetical protein
MKAPTAVNSAKLEAQDSTSSRSYVCYFTLLGCRQVRRPTMDPLRAPHDYKATFKYTKAGFEKVEGICWKGLAEVRKSNRSIDGGRVVNLYMGP